jgi:hypothetical protein
MSGPNDDCSRTVLSDRADHASFAGMVKSRLMKLPL